MAKRCSISKYASIIYRMSNIFYDGRLSPFSMGCGQQFFLLGVQENPGVSLLDLAQGGHYDKGTAARAVKKLAECGYIRRETDETDKRACRLYPTEKALPILEETKKMLEEWNHILTEGMDDGERETAEALMRRMAENARSHTVNERKRGKEWNRKKK